MGSSKSRLGTPDIHEGCAEDDINYVYRIPNHHKHSNQNTLQHHDTYQPQQLQEPPGMTPVPLPYPDPSEASGRPSWLPTSLLSLPKKDDIKPNTSSIYTENPTDAWSLSLAPAKKNSRTKLGEESEMREGIGLRRVVVSPDQEFGREIGTRAALPDCLDSTAKSPLLAIALAL